MPPNSNHATAGASLSCSTPTPSIASSVEERQARYSVNLQSGHSSSEIEIHETCRGAKHPSSDESPDFSFNDAPPKFTSTITWKAPFGDENEEIQTIAAEDPDLYGLDAAPASEDKPSRRLLSRRIRKIWHLRGYDDDGETDWWFASTAVPLLAATIAPLANVLSIAALVTYWRMDIRNPDDPSRLLVEFQGILYRDPRWCYWLNVGSLVCGFVGNIFLLANFTGRIRYIVALPVTIVLWYIATAILIALTIAMNKYVPPERPFQTYSQGFWYAVLAAILYLVCSFLLMFNMLGYFLGHYPQRFELTEHQRTLILQTMLFFIWLAGGGAVFSKIESMGSKNREWSFVDGLYFCDVTILTVGFGDLTLRNDFGRALIFPYTVGGIVMLGLVISSISKFAAEMSQDNVVRKHFERTRTRTLERTTTDPLEFQRSQILRRLQKSNMIPISAPVNPRQMHRSMDIHHQHGTIRTSRSSIGSGRRDSIIPPVRRRTNIREVVKLRHTKVRLLREERERFDEMRRIQQSTQRFKKYWALSLSVLAFAILWCIGAVVFWLAERKVQGMSYFQALYFCYVSLLTIGYGDFAPKSNAGRPFFVVWSLIAVPTITILISDMSSTVIDSFKRGTFVAADFTILLKRGVWHDFLEHYPKIKAYFSQRAETKAREKRQKEGILGPVHESGIMEDEQVEPSISEGNGEADSAVNDFERRDIERAGEDIVRLAKEVMQDRFTAPSEAKLARHLSNAIRRVASDINRIDRKYNFEEWAELTRLIRFTGEPPGQALKEEEEDVIQWDWLGDHSPMMANISEPEFVMEKLCESLARNMKRMEKKVAEGKKEIERLRRQILDVDDKGGNMKKRSRRLDDAEDHENR